MTSLYRQIILKALKIIFQNKSLLIFGIFAAAFNNFEIYNLFGKQAFSSPIMNTIISMIDMMRISNLVSLYTTSPLDFSILLLSSAFFIAFCILFIWLAVTSQISIIHCVHNCTKKIKINFNQALIKAKDNFWPVLSLNIGGKIGLYALAVIVNIPLVSTLVIRNSYSMIFSKFLYIVLFILFVILSSIIYFVIIYSIAYIVIKNYDAQNSLSKGYNLFKKNWLISIEMALVLFVINFIITILTSIFTYGLMMFILFLSNMVLSVVGYIFFILFVLFFVFFIVVMMGGLSVFHLASWILLFQELTKQTATSKIEQVAGKLNKKLMKKI